MRYGNYPHKPPYLDSRSIVISDKQEVRVEVVGNQNDVMLTIDGQQGISSNRRGYRDCTEGRL
jgi:NAD kinase